MNNIPKKRDLFKRDGGVIVPSEENVCLTDLTEAIGRLSGEASRLELQDNITSCKKSIDITFEIDKLSKMYRERMRGLRNEIRVNNKKSGKYKGNTGSLDKINGKV